MTDDAPGRPLRFGLVGTGHWARITHAPALSTTPGIEFNAVWGRNPQAAKALADAHGVVPYTDVDDLLAAVDAVAFSVPPDVQSVIALQAAKAGKHLLLEKPVALTEAAADALVAAVAATGVSSVVFFILRFQASAREWLAEVTSVGGWKGGNAAWLASAVVGSSPFNTPWRQDKGGLWDVGPHAISLLWPALGQVEWVTADAGAADLTHLILHHRGGATSTVTLTLSAPEAAAGFDLCLWGAQGRSAVPTKGRDPVACLQAALTELADSARTGRTAHPCDVTFGAAVTRVLAQAQRQLDAVPR